MTLLQRLFGKAEDPRTAYRPLYDAIVSRGRAPAWYLDGAPDTVDGRFDMIAAILAHVLIRLEGDPAAKQPSVHVAELFVDDMDGQLRQEGMGDLVVGKHIGKMMASLGGRIAAYRDGLEGDGLDEALVRNLYRGEHPGDAPLAFTAARLRQLWQHLAARDDDALLSGQFS